jgi:plasmid maintenance system antidote protein VapI
MNGDAMDIEASAKKLAESYTGLEKKVGSGDVPPKTADEYAVVVPDQFKDVWSEDDRFKSFRTDALAAGLTQKQFDFVMGKYFNVAPELVQGGQQVSADKASEELRTTWKTDTEFNANVQDAFKAFSAYADPADQARIDEIGNSPVALRILAKIGKEMGEAGGIPAANASTGADDIQAILKSDAYLNPKHADHKATSAKVQAFYQKKFGNTPA